MTKARVAVAAIGIYLIASIAAGIRLAKVTYRLPKRALSSGASYRRYVQAAFHASVENVSLTAADGAVLKAWYVQPARPNGESVILLHGLMDNRTGVSRFGDMFLRQRYSILLPDSRAHGESGSAIATYGILERQDVRRWVDWMRQRNPGCAFLFGESMGAAIGLQATAVTPQLCAVAVEGSYSNFRDIAYERLGHRRRIGALFWRTLGRPALEFGILYGQLRYGVRLTAASPSQAVEESKTPTLLIAGSDDRDIPLHHATELYRECANHCELWVVPGAGHGGASIVAPVEFQTRILGWFRSHDQAQRVPVAQAK